LASTTKKPREFPRPTDDVLPDSVLALPHERTVYLTLGTFFNAATEFTVPLQALRELPVMWL
jgi:hypothetical protein